MKCTRGTQRAGLMVLCGVALAVALSGCVFSVSWRGVSNMDEINRPQTRAEVRAAFGDADETGTCSDGRLVEYRRIRQRVQPVWEDIGEYVRHQNDGRLIALTVFYAPVIEAVALPVQAHRSEQAKLPYAFVYGADNRVVFRYPADATSSPRYWQAVRPLPDALAGQLEKGECLSWAGCLRAFATEVRHRAACVDYTLTLPEEDLLYTLQALAAEVDAGRLGPRETLAEFRWCLHDAPWACVRP